MGRHALGVLLLVASTPSLAAEHPVNAGLTAYNAAAVFPLPTLDADQLASLDEGEVVRIIERSDDPKAPARAIALSVSDHPLPALWVAALDPHLTVDPDLIETRLSTSESGRELWYGYYALPAPISDRHWVVESWNNHALAAATDNRAWEHAWKLVAHRMGEARVAVAAGRVEGVEPEAMDGAVLTPHNRGAWLVVRLSDGRSLLGYHATSTIGGSIPDWIVLRLVHARLDALMLRVQDRVPELVPEHYTPSHPDLAGGDGAPLTWRP